MRGGAGGGAGVVVVVVVVAGVASVPGSHQRPLGECVQVSKLVRCLGCR